MQRSHHTIVPASHGNITITIIYVSWKEPERPPQRKDRLPPVQGTDTQLAKRWPCLINQLAQRRDCPIQPGPAVSDEPTNLLVQPSAGNIPSLTYRTKGQVLSARVRPLRSRALMALWPFLCNIGILRCLSRRCDCFRRTFLSDAQRS